MTIYGLLYRTTQKLLHAVNLHYMKPFQVEGDTQWWCRWCGVRYTLRGRRGQKVGTRP